MKFLTLNCHSWQEENQREKIRYLAEVINEKDYDIITLQEVSQSINSKMLTSDLREDNFAVLLKEELDKYNKDKYNFYWDFSHIGYDIYEEGLAVFTKCKIVDEDSFFVTQSHDRSYWKTRKIVKLSIETDEKNIDVYSCHLGWWGDEEEPFENQVDNIMKRLNSNNVSLLMGDFNNNAFIRNEGYDYLLNQGLKDTFHLAETKDSGITVKGKIAGWDENKEKLRLDLILSNKDIDAKTSNVIFNGINKEIISDHYGVEAQINLK